jgi:hypothetical protein
VEQRVAQDWLVLELSGNSGIALDITSRAARHPANHAEPKDQKANRARRGSQGGRPVGFDRETYRRRNTVERCSNRLKNGAAWPCAPTSTPTKLTRDRAGIALKFTSDRPNARTWFTKRDVVPGRSSALRAGSIRPLCLLLLFAVPV